MCAVLAEASVDPEYFKHSRREVLPFVPAQRRRVLEVGCGEGWFAGSLTGVEEAWGIEPSEAAEVARTRLTRVFRSTFDDAESELPLGFFDVVICNDVIEHMPDYNRFLSTVGKHIAPGGMLIGSIPNVRFYNNMMQFLLEKDWHYTEFGVLDRTHVTFFTEKSLRKTLERHGFRVVALKGINTGVKFSNSARSSIYLGMAYALSAISFGYFSDILHLQFAFQATPKT